MLAGLVIAAGALIMIWWELGRSGDLIRAQTVALTIVTTVDHRRVMSRTARRASDRTTLPLARILIT